MCLLHQVWHRGANAMGEEHLWRCTSWTVTCIIMVDIPTECWNEMLKCRCFLKLQTLQWYTPSDEGLSTSQGSAAKRPRLSTPVTEKMRQYKSSLKYNPDWKAKWRWIEYDEDKDDMFCTFCKKHGKPPAVARGAWTSRPVNNWVKATELLKKHEQSDWHLASVEAIALDESAGRKAPLECTFQYPGAI